ncbi:unnamed protein product [Calypogeia fissa]
MSFLQMGREQMNGSGPDSPGCGHWGFQKCSPYQRASRTSTVVCPVLPQGWRPTLPLSVIHLAHGISRHAVAIKE